MDEYLKKSLKALPLILAFAILFFILYKIGFGKIISDLENANLIFIAIAFIMEGMTFFTWNIRWYRIVREVIKPRFWHLFLVLLAGAFVNTTTPGMRIGGEPLRAYYLSKEYKVSKSKLLATTVVDKAINTLVLSIIGIASILFVIFFLEVGINIKILLEIIIIAMFLLILSGFFLKYEVKERTIRKDFIKILHLIYYSFPFKLLRKHFKKFLNFEEYVLGKLHITIRTLRKILKDRIEIQKDILLGFVMWIFHVLGAYFLFGALGYNINLLSILVVYALSYILGVVLIVPGGIGVMETTMIALYTAFGIDPGIAAVVSITSRVFYYIYSLIFGYMSLVYLNLKKYN